MRLTIDDLDYKLTYNDNEWLLTLINTKKGTGYLIKKDFFFYGEEDDEHVEDVDVKTNAFKLAREVLRIVHKRMANDKPNYFFFKPSTKRKKRIYFRFAKELERMFKGMYKLDIQGSYFYFFKNI